MHIYTCAHMHTHTSTHMHTDMCTHAHMRVHTCTHKLRWKEPTFPSRFLGGQPGKSHVGLAGQRPGGAGGGRAQGPRGRDLGDSWDSRFFPQESPPSVVEQGHGEGEPRPPTCRRTVHRWGGFRTESCADWWLVTSRPRTRAGACPCGTRLCLQSSRPRWSRLVLEANVLTWAWGAEAAARSDVPAKHLWMRARAQHPGDRQRLPRGTSGVVHELGGFPGEASLFFLPHSLPRERNGRFQRTRVALPAQERGGGRLNPSRGSRWGIARVSLLSGAKGEFAT